MPDNHTPPRSRHEFKIAILCALPLEASALLGLFDAHWDAEKHGKEQLDTNAYSLGVLGSHNVVLVHMPNMGKVAAAVAAASLRSSFPGIQLALVVGICGGAPFGPSCELLLGDVVISEGLVQYDLGRRLPNTFVRKDTPGENLPRPRPEVCATLSKLKTRQGRRRLQSRMLEHLRLLRQRPDLTIPYPGSMNDRLFKSNYLHRHRPPSRRHSQLLQASNKSQPAIHFGLMATGDTVMRSGRDRDGMVARDKVIAFEMEGAGVWETFPAALVIKGVCDYADSHKNKTWQPYAAATAAAAAKAFLEHWNISKLVITISTPAGLPRNTRQFDTRKLEIMKRLNTSPYRDRKERNPDRHHIFQDWKESVSSRLLWVSADPGCGNVILTTTKTTDQKSVLFMQNPALLTEAIVNEIEAGGERFLASFSDLWHIILTAAQDVYAGEIICILDAIDECENPGRSQLAKELCKIYGPESRLNIKLKFLVTSRPFGSIRQGFQPLQIPGMPTIHLSGEGDEEMRKISAEIDIYIRARVEDIGDRSRLNREERHTLLEQLIRVPNRTYLWVHLTLDLIESDINIDKAGILQATAHIPKTVDEAYDRILSKSYDPEEATRILHIIVAAERALSLRELGFALSIRSHHRSCNDIDIKSEARLRDNVRDTCGLFITIIHSRVYLLHQTAKEFLVRDAKLLSPNYINPDLEWKHVLIPYESHKILAEICIFYLLILHDHEPVSRNTCILFDYSANYWATHLRESHAEISEPVAESILRICDVNSIICVDWLETFWKKQSNTTFPKKFTKLMIVSYFGLDTMVEMILSTTNDVELNARDGTYNRSALSLTAGNGFDDVVKLLVRGHRNWSRDFALLLFGNASEINTVDASGRTPLLHAILNGNVAVVETLIEAGARLDVTDNIGGTPLFYAMSYRREAIVKLLLMNGATPKSEDKMATHLFFSAVEKGDLQVVQLFLDSGYDIETRERGNQTPLLSALKMGHTDILQVLLDRGANIEVEDENGLAPLHCAVISGDVDIIQLFLNNGADINSVNSKKQTPLLLAMEMRHLDIVEVLLHQGAHTEAGDEAGRPALHCAVISGDIDMVLLLLNNNADINLADLKKRTPLIYAIESDNIELVKLLLNRGADIKSVDLNKHTPLSYAHEAQNYEVVQLLIERGAHIKSIDLAKLLFMHHHPKIYKHKLNLRTPVHLLEETILQTSFLLG
ncbi:ankyrin repeat-containing domain protein [Trichoderma compactum]